MNDHPIKHTIDMMALAFSALAGMSILPPLAALVSIIWTILRIVEMFTGKTINELTKGKKDD